jgi:hypothetical protein
MFDALKDAASGAVNAVANAGTDALMAAALKIAENEIEKEQCAGYHIDVEVKDIPDSWKDWIMKTGVNSLCVEDSWDFTDESTSNAAKAKKWKERNIKKIIMSVDEDPDKDLKSWCKCEVEWETGKTEMTIWWYPYAKTWSSDNSWLEGGYRRWWCLNDDIEFGLQLYQLPGKCFYKSDWLSGFEDPDPEGFLPTSTKKFDRWFQFRHWVIFWYGASSSGWNCAWTTTPPKLPDGSLFNLDAVLSLPSMPSLKMPSIKLPSLPDVSMPSLPSMPSMPSISAPSLSMPSLSMPSLSMPSIPEKPKRPPGKYDAHGCIEMGGLKVKASGKTLILSDATITHFWEEKDGSIRDEKKEHQRLELGTTDDEQTKSWVESLVGGGAEEGETGGCCTVA